MPAIWNKFNEVLFIILVAAATTYAMVTPAGALWALVGLSCMIMIALTQGQVEKMIVWLIFALVVVHFLKRLLFLEGASSILLYYQIQAIPVALMGVMLICAIGRLSRSPLILADIVVGLFFLFGFGLTMVKALKSGDIMGGLVAVTQNSGATLCYYIGRSLNKQVWTNMRTSLIWMFIATVLLGTIQFVGGPTQMDVKWAMSTADSSIQALKVVYYLYGDGEFRPYSTFAEPLGWGLFITFVWCVVEASLAGSGESAVQRTARRLVFIASLSLSLSRSCLLAGVAMLFFSWLLKRRSVGRPVFFIVGFSLAFIGVVALVQYLLENVINANWFPQWSSTYVQRLFNIGTLTQRGYAMDELWRALQAYGFVGVGWADQGALTVGKGAWLPEYQSHNGVVNLLVALGGTGMVLLIIWFVSWMRQVIQAIHGSDRVEQHQLRWAVAMILGYAATIFFSGQQFMNYIFWLMVGWTTTMSLVPSKSELQKTADALKGADV